MNNVNLMNLENMGNREIEEVRNILSAFMRFGTPEGFEEEGVSIEFNPNSGYVFMTNSEYQVAMLVEDRLENWYYLSYEGHEGFAEDLISDMDDSWNYEDAEQLSNSVYNYHPDLVEKLEKKLNSIEDFQDLVC